MNYGEMYQTAGGGWFIRTFGLFPEQHEMVVNMLKTDKMVDGYYSLERPSKELVDTWIENGDENSEFLRQARESGSTIFTLLDSIGDFSQPVGDVAVDYTPVDEDELSEESKSYLETALNTLQLAYNYAEGNDTAMEEISTAMDIIQNLI